MALQFLDVPYDGYPTTEPAANNSSCHRYSRERSRNREAIQMQQQKAAIQEKRRLAPPTKKKAKADGERRRYHINKTSINSRRRQTSSDQRAARGAVLAARRHRWETNLFSVEGGHDITDLRDAIQRRNEILSAAREAAGVNIKNASPCQHCGANLFRQGIQRPLLQKWQRDPPTIAPASAVDGRNVQLSRGMGCQLS